MAGDNVEIITVDETPIAGRQGATDAVAAVLIRHDFVTAVEQVTLELVAVKGECFAVLCRLAQSHALFNAGIEKLALFTFGTVGYL